MLPPFSVDARFIDNIIRETPVTWDAPSQQVDVSAITAPNSPIIVHGASDYDPGKKVEICIPVVGSPVTEISLGASTLYIFAHLRKP